jgi:hypothetical protein
VKTDSQSAEQRLRTEIARALERTNYLTLRQVELRCEADTVVLMGQTPTYFLKQLAQVVAMDVSGVRRVDNRLRVGHERDVRDCFNNNAGPHSWEAGSTWQKSAVSEGVASDFSDGKKEHAMTTIPTIETSTVRARKILCRHIEQ